MPALRDEAAYSVVELITVMAILSVVLGGIVSLFVAGTHADTELNSRYQAQSAARLALDRLRRDGHSACGLATGYSATSVTLVMPADSCVAGSNSITWCTLSLNGQYALYRNAGSSTCSAGPVYARYLTSASVFTYTAPNTPSGSYSLARLNVDLRVNRTPTKSVTSYRLVDDIAMRNSPRQ